MNYIGTWKFHSIGVMHGDELVYLSAEEYMKEPMPYIDETDPDAVADELRERKIAVDMQVKICEGGQLFLLTPIPEGAPKEELEAVLASGDLMLVDGMLTEHPVAWEERDGELWYDTGIEGEVFGEPADSWVKAMDENGFFVCMTTRFAKVD